jgi:hypothetical protein
MDYKGDKWKYLIDHPETRACFATSGQTIYNELYTNAQIYNNTYFMGTQPGPTWSSGNTGVGGNNYYAYYWGDPLSSTLTFPLEFGVTIIGSPSTALFQTFYLGFLKQTSAYSVSSGVNTGSLGNLFNANNETGFSIQQATGGSPISIYNGWGGTQNLSTSTPQNLFTTNWTLTTTYYFRIPISGTKIGYSIDGVTWVYVTLNSPLNLNGLAFKAGIQNNTGNNLSAGTNLVSILKTPVALANAS